MKFLVLVILAIFGVALAEIDFLATETSNDRVFQNIEGPLSFLISKPIDEDEQLVDDQVLLEATLGRNLVSQVITESLESFRDIIIYGNESLPPLDPLEIDILGPYRFSMLGARASATVKNIRAEGLRWYTVDNVSFNPIRLTVGVQMTLPWLIITGSYDAEARVALLLTHKARGNVRIFINRMDVDVNARIGTNILNGHLLLRSLDVKIDVGDSNIQIDGMTGSAVLNSFINSFVQNLSQDIIQAQVQAIGDKIAEIIFNEINDILKDYTINDILS